MYNFRLTSFLVFGFLFWVVSMLSTSIVWILLAFLASQKKNKPGAEVKDEQQSEASVKDESDDDTLETTSEDSRPGPSDDPSQKIKEEEDPEEGSSAALVGEAARGESGTGTGLESVEARGIQKRRSRILESEDS